MKRVTSSRDKFTFTFEGKSIAAFPGQTVAAAILNHGLRILRFSRLAEQPRSVFCGIGVCFDCLVVINGVCNQRSCLITAQPGQRVEIQIGTGEFTFAEPGEE